MIEWIFYCAGILFLIIFLISVMIKPVIFEKKWQAGVGYGLSSILYFVLFLLLLNSREAVKQMNIQNQYPGSTQSQTAVSGPVPQVNPSSNQQGGISNSVEFLTPTGNSANFQKDFINLQDDLNALQNNSGKNNTNTVYAYSTDNKDKLYLDKNGKGTIIGDTQNKTYYVPGSSSYNNEIKNTQNSVYFISTWAAESAGYKASR